jgi:glycosyltransferase involved in cell wall biosynthesis
VFGLVIEFRREVSGKAFRGVLKLVGKGDQTVAAVFGHTAEVCHLSVAHMRAGASGLPIWLFSTAEPRPETAALCERVCVDADAARLVWRAQCELWTRWVALSLGAWTGDRAPWILKLAPLFIPPFRTLFLNASHDFLAGTPSNIARHNLRAVRDAAHGAWHRGVDLAGGCWRLVSYHIWRTGPVVRVKDLACAYRERAGHGALWLASTLLRWMDYPHRRWFTRLHGAERLNLETSVGVGSEIANFAQTEPVWQGAELKKFARTNEARYIFWHESGAVEDPGDMLPLFDDERTFAVSRQVDYRGWKPQLAAGAPFRTLQPGEATRVLAPVSRAVLVDRRKLAALGVPACSLPGAAWMLLFWRAAAAGWRSYSIGARQPVIQQVDAPMAETSFLLHVMADRELRRLGPAEPALCAGNIAFEPMRRRALSVASGRMRVLVVSPFLPFPLSHGGAVRIYNLCRALAGRVDFALAAIREKDEAVDYARLHEVFREVRVVDLDERAVEDERLPKQVRHHRSESLRVLIADMAGTWKPDVVQIEYTHMSAFGDCAPGIPSILVEHDLTFSLYRQLAESQQTADSWREYERWRDFEHARLCEFDGVWTVSDDDRRVAVRETAREPEATFTVPNGVDTECFRPSAEPGGEPEILYVGSFRHLPNLIGFDALGREVMPRVWARNPAVRLRVVAGPKHEEFWAKFAPSRGGRIADPRITVHGFVEDLRPLYERAWVVAVPLAVSAGTNIKVLEAMACGKAIVSTPTGCAGLGLMDGSDLLVRESWGEFADALTELIADPDLRRRLGVCARQAAEARCSWQAIAGRAWASYLRVSGRARMARAARERVA